MMIAPNCPNHGRLVLDLALGRLDDDAAAEAESLSESCPVCRVWWKEQFEGGVAEAVDQAVAATFTDLQLPARRRSRGWMAAAAAAVMALGVGALWVSQNSMRFDEVVAPQTASIQALDFEIPDAVGEFVIFEGPDPDPAPGAEPAVRQAVAEEAVAAAADPVEVEEPAETLFSGGFESGHFNSWVPTT